MIYFVLQPSLSTKILKSPSHSISILNESGRFVAPLDELVVEHIVSFPEGNTLMVSIHYSVIIVPPGNPTLAGNFRISEPHPTSIVFPMSDR